MERTRDRRKSRGVKKMWKKGIAKFFLLFMCWIGTLPVCQPIWADEVVDDTESASDNSVPSSTSSYVVVGSNWVTPVANYGEAVIITLPIVNMGKSDMRDVVVTPVISTKTEEFPFEIDLTGYSLKFDRLMGENSSMNITDRTKDLFWTFRTRTDVKNGYYKIDYQIQFTNDACEQEEVTISTYVLAVGKPGSGDINGTDEENKKVSTPRLIVTGFETDPEEVYAGNTFTLTLHILNTSRKTSVMNVEIDLVAAVEGKEQDTTYYAFLPVYGSSTVFVDSLAPGGMTDISIEMAARADLAQKPYVLEVKMKYEDSDANPFEGAANVSIPVKQEMKFETSTPEIMPSSIDVGSESNVMFSIYNTGKTKLYNIQVKFQADSITGGDAFVGNLESGATGNVDVMLTGAQETVDEGKVDVIISYEDETSKVYTRKEEIELFVTQPIMEEEFGEEDMEGMDGEEETGMNPWITRGIVGGVILLGGIASWVTIRKKKKKAMELKLLEEELEDEGK